MLQRILEAAGVPVWRDTASLWPGENWRLKIRDAITRDALVFIACFSTRSAARRASYQNEELLLAIEQLRLRRPDDPWLIPVRFDDCEVPDLELGAGRTLASIQRVDLFGARRDLAAGRLVAAVRRLLGQRALAVGQPRDAVVPTAEVVSRLAVVSGLPAQPVFVGREGELSRLAQALAPADDGTAADSVAVVSVAGMAGVGKTAIAVRAASEASLAGWFPGGVLMVDLRGYDSPERRVQPTAALASLLRASGVPSEQIPPEQAEREWLWRTLLAGELGPRRRILIVADNASSAEQVRPLVPAAGGHGVLVTSRHTLADLDGALLLDVPTLPPGPAVELLRQALEAAHPGDDRVRTAPEAAEQLARLCGGLPLAIRIVAALLAADPGQPIAELAEALASENRRLKELDYDGSLTVRAAFALSYQHLPQEQARLFRLLAVNPGPEVSIGAAAALLGRDITETRREAGRLRRAHLLEDGTARGRWRMHDLVRLFAVELADEDPERELAFDRLLGYYLTTCQDADRRIGSGRATAGDQAPFRTRQDALEWLDAEHENLVKLIRISYDTERYAVVVGLSISLYEFFGLRLHVSDWIETHQLALVASRVLDDRQASARVRIHLGSGFWRLRQYPPAEHHYRRALETFTELGDRCGEADALRGLGTTCLSMKRHEAAVSCYQQALGIYRELADRSGQAAALNGIGLH